MTGPLVVLALAAATAALVVWHSRTYAYVCDKCGSRFAAGVWQDLLGAQCPPDRKYMKCPGCGERTWTREERKRA